MCKQPIYFRILYPDHTKKLVGSLEEVQELTGIKIEDPENFQGGGINGTLIEPVYESGQKKITAMSRAKTLNKVYGL